MRILQLGPYPPPHGGVQTSLVAIRRFLLARGIPCGVVNLTRHRRPGSEGIYYPRNSLEVASLLLRLPCDIVHMHVGGNFTARLFGLAFFCSSLPAKKSVLTLHSGGYPSFPEAERARPNSLRGFVFRRLDRIIAVNPEMLGLFREFGVPVARLRLISPHSFSADAPADSLPARIETFFRSHSPVLLTVSGLEPEYDLPLQIDVLALVRERHPRAGLMIIGQGSLDNELCALARSRSYAGHILFCGDLPHPQALAAIRRCDVSLRTTLYDGDSISVREALHFGVPVVASDNRMRPAGVHLVPPRDLAALDQAIEHCLLNRPLGESRRPESDEQNLAAILDLYRELMR